jgi:hypothetical protein
MAKDRLRELSEVVDRHIQDFKRDTLLELESLFSPENLGTLLAQDRFSDGLRADVANFLRGKGSRPPKGRHSSAALATIASALTEPIRTDCWRILKHSIKRRLKEADWLDDTEKFKRVVEELVTKQVRMIIDRRARRLKDSMTAGGQLAILLQERDEQE